MKAKNNSNQLIINRIFDAPVNVVWEAWTDIKKTAQWWGPRGFSITTKSKDLRPGGQWIYTMHGPDGVDYPNITTYFIVEKYKRLEYDHGANENQKALFRVNVEFSEHNSKTMMKLSMTFESPQIAKDMSKFIKDAGGNSTWDRLGEFVKKECSNKDVFLLNRVFEAPIEKVFAMFTDVKHMEKWQSPKGFYMKVLEGKIEEGNNVFYEMGSAEFKFYGRSTYKKINRPEYISFEQEFCNEKGETTKHPGAPVWPARWLTSLSLFAEDATSTRLCLQSELLDSCTSAELQVFIKERGGMTKGWNGSLDNLEDYIENNLASRS